MEDVSAPSLEWLVWFGTTVSLIGLVGLILCILRVNGARRAQLGDAEMREVIRKVLPLNLGALFLSVIGLMIVIVGIFLT